MTQNDQGRRAASWWQELARLRRSRARWPLQSQSGCIGYLQLSVLQLLQPAPSRSCESCVDVRVLVRACALDSERRSH